MDREHPPQPLARRRRRQRTRAHTITTAGNSGADAVHVGGALRALRETRGLSIRALAEQSGLAVNTLSLIENGKTSPSVSTLQQLATTLRVPITAFFEPHGVAGQVIHTRVHQRPHAAFDQGMLEDLGAGLTDCPIEPFLITLASGASSGPGLITHGGYEFVLCVSGGIDYTVHQQAYRLEPGDSLLFEAHLPHRWQNASEDESRMLILFCTPDERQPPEQIHFASR